MKTKAKMAAAGLALLAGAWARAATLHVEAESFATLGGWTVETQSIRQEGSSYLMAHGYGVPVADAETTVQIPSDGTYAVWARTRNWNAPWTGGAAGRFQVVLRGTGTPAWTSAELGTEGADWHWQRAGEAALKAGACRVVLHDRTGFNGRCDALFFASAGERPPARTPPGTVRDDPKEWGLVVVGGGFAGCCTALAAAREGVPTLLLQDREVLGGCNSSEVRVGLGGRIHAGPYPKLGEVVAEIQPLFGGGRPLDKRFYEDDRKDTAFLIPTLWRGVAGVAPARRYRQHVFAVEMDPVQTNRIAAVLARDTRSGAVTRVRARLFCDATGDAIVSRLAGCETMYGREARARFNEISAPVAADRRVMGMSVQWLTEWRKEKAPFPDISEWTLPIDETTGYYQTSGSWEQESGFYHDMADETERIRDYALLAIFSNWHWLKNRSARRANYANVAFSWISPIGGKRESHRTVGAYVLNQNDLENHVAHPDGTAAVTWDIDLHFPDPENARKFKEPFRSAAYHRGFGADYPVPYRCLYARDCRNLFLAGRDISCSHVAFAAVRVQRTLGMLGEVVGLAAGICHRRACLPADVSATGLDELKAAMARGVTPLPQFHGYHNGMGEKYDFNRRGWAHVYPQGRTNNLPDALAADIRGLGFVHRNEHPALADRRRRLVLVDESRARLHSYDSADPSAGFAVPIRKPGWDLKAVGGTRYRTVCRGGFQVTDLAARKVVDTFDFPIFHSAEPTACCDLPDGGFVFSVNPVGPDKGKAIHFCVFSPDRTMTRIIRLRGFVNARSFAPGRDGEWLVAHEHGFARVRFPDEGRDVAAVLVKDYPQPAGRNSFDVRPAARGTGFWTTTGYGAELLRVAADGTVVRRIRAEQGGKANVFYAQLTERADGNVYVANWTGHGAQDSYRGWQVVEFAPSGEVVWRLDSPERYGSISGVLEIE